MKHPELRTLSEDHHHGLVHARRLRRAVEVDETTSAESTARDFLRFLAEGHSPPLSQGRGGPPAGSGALRRRSVP